MQSGKDSGGYCVFAATAQHLYRLNNISKTFEDISRGAELGVIIVGENLAYDLVVYNRVKVELCRLNISQNVSFQPQNESQVTVVQHQTNETWAILFKQKGDRMKFLRMLSICKFHVSGFQDQSKILTEVIMPNPTGQAVAEGDKVSLQSAVWKFCSSPGNNLVECISKERNVFPTIVPSNSGKSSYECIVPSASQHISTLNLFGAEKLLVGMRTGERKVACFPPKVWSLCPSAANLQLQSHEWLFVDIYLQSKADGGIAGGGKKGIRADEVVSQLQHAMLKQQDEIQKLQQQVLLLSRKVEELQVFKGGSMGGQGGGIQSTVAAEVQRQLTVAIQSMTTTTATPATATFITPGEEAMDVDGRFPVVATSAHNHSFSSQGQQRIVPKSHIVVGSLVDMEAAPYAKQMTVAGRLQQTCPEDDEVMEMEMSMEMEVGDAEKQMGELDLSSPRTKKKPTDPSGYHNSIDKDSNLNDNLSKPYTWKNSDNDTTPLSFKELSSSINAIDPLKQVSSNGIKGKTVSQLSWMYPSLKSSSTNSGDQSDSTLPNNTVINEAQVSGGFVLINQETQPQLQQKRHSPIKSTPTRKRTRLSLDRTSSPTTKMFRLKSPYRPTSFHYPPVPESATELCSRYMDFPSFASSSLSDSSSSNFDETKKKRGFIHRSAKKSSITITNEQQSQAEIRLVVSNEDNSQTPTNALKHELHRLANQFPEMNELLSNMPPNATQTDLFVVWAHFCFQNPKPLPYSHYSSDHANNRDYGIIVSDSEIPMETEDDDVTQFMDEIQKSTENMVVVKELKVIGIKKPTDTILINIPALAKSLKQDPDFLPWNNSSLNKNLLKTFSDCYKENSFSFKDSEHTPFPHDVTSEFYVHDCMQTLHQFLREFVEGAAEGPFALSPKEVKTLKKQFIQRFLRFSAPETTIEEHKSSNPANDDSTKMEKEAHRPQFDSLVRPSNPTNIMLPSSARHVVRNKLPSPRLSIPLISKPTLSNQQSINNINNNMNQSSISTNQATIPAHPTISAFAGKIYSSYKDLGALDSGSSGTTFLVMLRSAGNNRATLFPGTRVKWCGRSEKDPKTHGTVIGHADNDGWIIIEWDHSSRCEHICYGAGDIYEVEPLEPKDMPNPSTLYAMKRIICSDVNAACSSLQEALLLSFMDCPEIIRTKDVFMMFVPDTKELMACFVMEYMEGGNMDTRITFEASNLNQSSHIGIPLITQWTTQLLTALSVLHSQDIVHRDIKPANLLLSSNDDLVLSDFGVSAAPVGLTPGGKGPVGTPAYMVSLIFNFVDSIY
eukprot:TRINITY_DN1674_c0_g2_i2.p1 TRINITY_DN1674_c0_g2~~TRINITY_DN1674_c0_g2_i2.p1  ORF type:complete len:1287 (-),score=353.48 TRINITY_DN1674_c0_g2_i2:868-4728(-)